MFYKKNNKVHFAVIFAFILLMCTCNGNQKKNSQLFRQAEQALSAHPDTTLLLIRTIEKPEELGREDYANYLLLQVEAHEKIGVNIKNDTLIHISASYYSDTRDSLKAAKSNLYAAKVYLAQGNNEKAMKYLLVAKDFAESNHNTNLLGLIYHNIGNAYSGGGSFRKALDNFKKAQSYYSQSGNKKREILVEDHIGNMVWQFGDPDSALIHFQRVLDYAEETRNEWYVARSHRRLGCVYRDLKQYDKAKFHALTSMSLDKEGDDEIFNYPTLAMCYLHEEKLDSALYYTEMIRETKNGDAPESLLIYHDLKSKVLETKGDYAAALEESREIIRIQNSITEERRDSSIPYAFEQHEKERIENNYHLVVIQRLRLVIAVIVVILSGVLVAWLLMYRIKRKETELVEARQALRAFSGTITQQYSQLQYYGSEISKRDQQLHTYNELLAEQSEDYDRLLSERNEKDERLRAILMDRLDIARRVAQMNVVATENTHTFMAQFHKVFGKNLLDWELIRPAINELYNGFVDKLAEAHPGLGDKDLQLCSLVRAGFRTEELAVLLDMTQSSVQVKRTRLVKRMGFDSAKSFLSYLVNL